MFILISIKYPHYYYSKIILKPIQLFTDSK